MKKSDDLLYQPVRTSAPSLQETFSLLDEEIQREQNAAFDSDELRFIEKETEDSEPDSDGFEVEEVGPHLESLIGERGDINKLHAAYLHTKTLEARDALLVDVHNFSLRLFASESFQDSLNGIAGEDIAQDVVTNVLPKLDSFRGESKFSSWVFGIMKNVVRDAVRKTTYKKDGERVGREAPLFEEAFHAESHGEKVIAGGHGPDGEQVDDETHVSVGDRGGDGQRLFSPKTLHAESEGILTSLALSDAVKKLSSRDRYICKLLTEGYDTSEIASKTKLDTKQVYNLVARFRATLKEETYALADVVVHTCKISVTSLKPCQRVVGYIQEEGGTFRAMPLSCRCRKLVTHKQARLLVEKGDAQEVHHFNKDGAVVVDDGRIWAAQAVKVWRGGLRENSSAGMERASSEHRGALRDIEIGNEITLTERSKLIITEASLRARGINPYEWSGRAVMVGYSAKRVESQSIGVDVDRKTRLPLPEKQWQAPPPSLHPPEKPIVVAEGQKCPSSKCTYSKGRLTVAVYSDGAVRHACKCGYLMVFKKIEGVASKVAPSNVIEMKPAIQAESSSVLAEPSKFTVPAAVA